MKFGVREICDVVFKAKAQMKIGNATFQKGQPVLYIDTAKTSTVEGAATTVYATGGVGNTRLIAWEGEKTLTFTVEDALLSPIGFSILSGAGLFKDEKSKRKVHVHTTAYAPIEVSQKSVENDTVTIDLTNALNTALKEEIDAKSPIFISITDDDGSITGNMLPTTGLKALTPTAKESVNYPDTETSDTRKVLLTLTDAESATANKDLIGKTAFVDFYILKDSASVSELQIDAANFGGYFYVEASTLFRRQSDGVDMPAELTFPNVKVQSNFTFNMASTGDPSTFTFTMDAFPGYTHFDNTKKVLCVMQVVEDAVSGSKYLDSVMD